MSTSGFFHHLSEITKRTPAAIGGALAVAALGLVAGGGCSSEGSSGNTENKLHKPSAYSSEQLNAPLSAQAKARGAQAPPPPIR